MYKRQVEATSEDLTKLVAKIRGKEGTKVTLEIRRGEEADPFTVEVERKNVEPVSYTHLLEQQHLLMQKYLVSCPERMISQLWMSQQTDG